MHAMDWQDEVSNKYLKELFMQAPVSFSLLCGKNMIVRMVNKRALEFSGMTYDEVINRPFYDVYPELADQGFKKITLQVFETGIPFRATELPMKLLSRRKTETEFINLTLEPLKNKQGKITGIIGVATDVTMLVLSRDKVRESEERYRGIFESMNQGFCILDIILDEDKMPYDYSYVEVNPAFGKISGLKNVIGKTAREVIPEYADFWIKNYGEVALSGESKIISGDAGKWYESFAFKLGDNKSRKVGVLFTDVSTRKEEEDQRNQFSEYLQAEVEERTRELTRSNLELLHFTYVASHDLREPVRKIETFTRRLLHEADTLPTEKKSNYLERILKAVERQKHMIDGVLAYSAIESTKPDFELIDLNEIVNAVRNELDSTIKNHRAKFNVSILPVIEGSAELIYQLFYHLIFNSLKFNKPDEPVTISVSSEELIREVTEFVSISVSDTGIGFNPLYKDRIFESFMRLHAKDSFEGSGMGLAVCRKIVEKHHGTITASGEENKGALFRIELPVKQNL